MTNSIWHIKLLLYLQVIGDYSANTSIDNLIGDKKYLLHQIHIDRCTCDREFFSQILSPSYKPTLCYQDNHPNKLNYITFSNYFSMAFTIIWRLLRAIVAFNFSNNKTRRKNPRQYILILTQSRINMPLHI